MLKKSFRTLSNEALGTLASETMILVVKGGSSVIGLNDLYVAISPAYRDYMSLLNKETYSGMGTQIAKLDKRRDNAYNGFYDVVKGFARFYGEEEPLGKPAHSLLPYFEKAGTMYKKTYAQQTSAIDVLTNDLDTRNNFDKMTLLGVLNIYTILRELNSNFKDNYADQINANSDLRQQGSATELRKPLEEALKQFYTLVEAMKKTEPWADLYSDLSELMMRTKF